MEGHDGLLDPSFDDEEGDQHRDAESEQAEDFNRGPALVLRDGERDQHRDQAGGQRGRSDEVDVAPGRFGADEGQEGRDHEHAEQANRQVDVEHPAPAEVVGQETADDRSDD